MLQSSEDQGATQTVSDRRSAWRRRGWLPGVLASVLAIGVLWWLVDWRAVVAALASIPAQTLLLAVLCYLVSTWARARCWQAILPAGASFGRVFMVMQEGYLLNNLFPFRLGELLRAILMGRTLNRPPLSILSTIVMERMYDVAMAATMLLAALPFMVRSGQAAIVAAVGLLAVGGVFVILWGILRYRERWMSWQAVLVARLPHWAGALLKRLEQVIDGFTFLTRPWQVVVSFAWMAVSWCCLVAEYLVLLRGLSPAAKLAWALFALGAGMLGGALPSAPSALGLYEAAVVGALALFSVPLPVALSLAILVHLIHLLFSSIVGFWGMMQEGDTVLAVYRKARALMAST